MALPSWLNGASVNQWLSITVNASTNKLSDVAPDGTESPAYPGSDNALSMVEAWSDGALRVQGSTIELLCHSGGHGDGSYNGIIKFGNINSDSPSWSVQSGSFSNPVDVAQNVSHYNDSPSKPSAMHGYRLLAYEPDDDALVRMGAADVYGPAADSFKTVDSFSFSTNSWTKKTTSSLLRTPAQGAAVFNSNDRKIYYWYGGGGFPYDGLTSFDNGTDTHTTAASGNTSSELSAGTPIAHDTSRNHLLVLDTVGNEFRLWDNFNSSPLQTPKTITLSGDTEILTLTLAGLIYDPDKDLYIFYRGLFSSPDQRKAIYQIDPSPYDESPQNLTWTCTRVNPSSGVTPVAPVSAGEGINGRFIYVSTDDFSGYLLYRQHDGDVYFYPTIINQTVTPTGVAATGQAGALNVLGSANIALDGVTTTAQAGDLSVVVSANVALTGVTVSGNVGDLLGFTQDTAVLIGVEANGQVGTLSITTNAALTLGGVSAAGQVGSVSINVGGDETVILTGVSAVGQAGVLTAVEAQQLTLQGVEASSVVGVLQLTTNAALTLDGVSATGQAGAITADVANLSLKIPNHRILKINGENRTLIVIAENRRLT